MKKDRRQPRSRRRAGLELSIWEGPFGTGYAVLTREAILTGFLLFLGASSSQIAIVVALGVLAQVAPVVVSPLLSGRSKQICLPFYGASRLCWLPVLLLAFLPLQGWCVPVFIALFGLSRFLEEIGRMAWMSWMGHLVPPRIRGRYFSRRNAWQLLFGLGFSLAGAGFLDSQGATGGNFAVVFGVAMVLSLVSTGLLIAQPDPGSLPSGGKPSADPPDEAQDPMGEELPGGILSASGVRLTPYSPGVIGAGGSLPARANVGSVGPRHPLGSRRLHSLRLVLDNPAGRFLVFLALWAGFNGFSAPFWNVFLLSRVHVSFSLLAQVGAAGALMGALCLPVWGNVADRSGSKTVLFITILWGSLHPLLYLIMTPDRLWPLWIDGISSGIVWNGFELAITNLTYEVAPRAASDIHFGKVAAVRGFANGLSSALAGLLILWIPSLSLGGIPLCPEQVIFVSMTVLRIMSALTLVWLVPTRSPRLTGG